ncbi:MAG: Asp-tRNA(Asn)/Glu-tRNA(Gln) amidotransferase subunit GatC [Burkholderiales bacterium]|nr:Asp-tRNA(Asn)/Glu-tRNA(Gln) amidotransferase subunit GatC [Burkholderiales bacterium]
MALTLADVARIAHLARLDLDAAEAETVLGKLQSIFTLIDALDAADTTGVEPMAHAQDLAMPLRDDVVTETDQHAVFQRGAPAVADDLYLVPKVIE